VGGTIAGIAGAFLAVPIATVAAAVLEYVREQRQAPASDVERPARRGVLLRNGSS
jgi:predicted PurR-regulated permease PerM